MKIIGAAAGSIIAAIMTVQTDTKMAALPKDHSSAVMPAMAMPAIPSPAIPPRTAMPMGMPMLMA